jgi:CBS domain-containing protein
VGLLLAASFIAVGVLIMLGVGFRVVGGGFAEGVALALLGWFLTMGARAAYRSLLARELLSSVRVSHVMRSRIATVSPDFRLSKLVHQFLLDTDQLVFPVVEDGRLTGFVGTKDVRSLDPDEWPGTEVSAVMTSSDHIEPLSSRDNVLEALERLEEADTEELPVVDEGEIAGMLRRRDVAKWMTLNLNT